MLIGSNGKEKANNMNILLGLLTGAYLRPGIQAGVLICNWETILGIMVNSIEGIFGVGIAIVAVCVHGLILL